MIQKIIDGLNAREKKYIAKAISILENNTSQSEKLLNQISLNKSHSVRIGITGPPGAGKSTITNQLIKKIRKNNKSVCALLVDPSSPFTNGAVLGDRIRMQDFHKDDNVFIRSIASRGSKGGLSENIENITNVLNYCKFDVIIFETVGIGQIELDVIEAVDTVAVILVPESGDDIQMMKAGLIEIADIYVINKYDRQDSNKLYIALSNMLKLVANKKWTPKIIKTIAIDNKGTKELYDEIFSHLKYLQNSGEINNKNDKRYIKNVKNLIISDFEKSFWSIEKRNILNNELKKEAKERLSIQKLFKKIKSK